MGLTVSYLISELYSIRMVHARGTRSLSIAAVWLVGPGLAHDLVVESWILAPVLTARVLLFDVVLAGYL